MKWGRDSVEDNPCSGGHSDVTFMIAIEEKDASFYLACIASLPTKWNKCIELEGIILKNNKTYSLLNCVVSYSGI